MLLLKYINDNTIYEVESTRNSENLVTIKGNLPAKKVGFTLNRSMSYADNWDYSTFKTVYRVLDDGFQFSNDGSVWVAPPAPEYKVTFIAHNGSIEGEAVQVVKDYSEVVVPKVNAFENYTLQGWSEELPAEGEVTENKTVYAVMNYEEPVSLVIDRKIAELNSALGDFSDDEKNMAKDKLDKFNADPMGCGIEVNDIVKEINACIGAETKKKEKAMAAEINSQNNFAADIFGCVDTDNDDDKNDKLDIDNLFV